MLLVRTCLGLLQYPEGASGLHNSNGNRVTVIVRAIVAGLDLQVCMRKFSSEEALRSRAAKSSHFPTNWASC